jgi:hypothetical protein
MAGLRVFPSSTATDLVEYRIEHPQADATHAALARLD